MSELIQNLNSLTEFETTQENPQTPKKEIDTSKTIQWDEETIAEHDKERGTRQKIDEAPTPYRYHSESDDEGYHTGGSTGSGSGRESFGSKRGGKKVKVNFGKPKTAQIHDNLSTLQAKLNLEHMLQQSSDSVSVLADDQPSVFQTELTRARDIELENESEDQDIDLESIHASQRSPEFNAKRNAHYNEFQVLKAMRASRMWDEEDEDD